MKPDNRTKKEAKKTKSRVCWKTVDKLVSIRLLEELKALNIYIYSYVYSCTYPSWSHRTNISGEVKHLGERR